ncbi:MAG: branched-chain amino acid ABC transporter permease [Jaaginema sp. PMC 1079.18]|nr:branched-chain amino acid ABC transporter permease [Jaaginema sp. PMC 1080.18]MEC4850061.1 branched-chain amino acid ABC transporter permease [Jaaginema sp. PMC 1079.18]MEC4864636.1 branched-chain amino acid ABC transporter permease [Jaaginema sp. PMC 1078.18]
MLSLVQGIFDGIGIGSVLLLAALGLAIVFGLMGVINLAHGELMMLGAYATFVVQNIFKPLGEPWTNFYIFAALPVAFVVAAIMGLVLERGVIRFLYGRPLETLLATWGVSLLLRQIVRSGNWVMAIGLAVFCVLFFGTQWGLRTFGRRIDWEGLAPGILIARIVLEILVASWLLSTVAGSWGWLIGLPLFAILFVPKWSGVRNATPQIIQNWFLEISILVAGAIATLVGILITQGENAALTKPWFSARNVDVTAPQWLQGGIPLGDSGFQIPMSRIFIIILTILCLLGTYWFLNKSNWGLRIRSVTQNRSMSACLGIPTEKVDALTFALGSGLAGIAGCAITLLGSVGPNTGQNYIVDTFMVVVVGGVGNLFGSIIAAMAIGVLTFLLGSGTIAFLIPPSAEALKPITDFFMFFATASMAKVMVFALIIAFLQFKPAGIFAPKGRTAEM